MSRVGRARSLRSHCVLGWHPGCCFICLSLERVLGDVAGYSGFVVRGYRITVESCQFSQFAAGFSVFEVRHYGRTAISCHEACLVAGFSGFVVSWCRKTVISCHEACSVVRYSGFAVRGNGKTGKFCQLGWLGRIWGYARILVFGRWGIRAQALELASDPCITFRTCLRNNVLAGSVRYAWIVGVFGAVCTDFTMLKSENPCITGLTCQY